MDGMIPGKNPTNRNVDHWLVNSDPYHSLSLSLLMAYYN